MRIKIKINTHIKISDRDKETTNSNHCKRNYINRLTRNVKQVTYWPMINQALRQQPHRRRRIVSATKRSEELEPRTPVSINKINVRAMQGLTLIEYQKVPINQSADSWLTIGSSHQSDDFCDCCISWSSMIRFGF